MKRDKSYWCAWFKAALVRAVKTMAQTAVGMLTVNAYMHEINWIAVASASGLAGIVSMLMSLAGLPEVEEPVDNDKEEK